MNDTTTPEPTKSPAQSFEMVNYSGFAEKHYKLNLPIIIAALRKAKTQSVDIRFYGSHDEGQIEEVNIKPSLDPMPQVAVHSARHVIGGGIESTIKTMNLDSAIEALVYDQIDMSFGGSWETEEGGGGHFFVCYAARPYAARAKAQAVAQNINSACANALRSLAHPRPVAL